MTMPRTVLSLILLCALVSPHVVFAVPVVETVDIAGLQSIGKDELLYLLDIVPGEPIDEGRVRDGIKRAFLKGIFDDIAVEVDDWERAAVRIRVREKPRVEKISVAGDHAFSRGTILSLFPVKEGEYLSCNAVEKAAGALREAIAIRGFPRARVDAAVEPLGGRSRVGIRLIVDTGVPERIAKIVIVGTTDDVRSVLRISEGDIYDQITVQKEIERVRKYYKDRHYLRPTVKLLSYRDGVLVLSVLPGRRLLIAIDGNEAISGKKILAEMPFRDAEDFNDDIVQEAVHRLQALYHANGFPFAQIAPVVTERNDVITVTFFIFEGKMVRTGRISFDGVSLDEDRLRRILSLREGTLYNPEFFETDRETLRDFYFALGYLNVSIGEFRTSYDETSRTMNITIPVEEGERTEIGRIDIVGTRIVSEDEVRRIMQLQPGAPYNDVDISNARYRLIEFYTTKGFPMVDVTVQRSFDAHRANVLFVIEEGPLTLFGKTIVTGNRKTRYAVIRRELLKEENAPFDYSLLRKEKQRLYRLGLFTDVNVEMLEGENQRRDVLVSLHEGNAGAVEFGLGYSDYEQYRGYLDVSYRNLWGMHRQASVRTELSALHRRLILQYYEPWFLDGATALRAFFLTEHREEINIDTRETRYKLSRNAISSGVERKIGPHIKSELFYEFSVVNTYDVQPDVILTREDTGTLVISGLRLGLIYDTRNDPFYPSRGILAGVAAKLTSPLFLSESDFVKLSFYGNIYHELVSGIVCAASLRGGFAKGYGATAELPIVERFFLGGRTTVRGYEQDTLGPKGSDGSPTGGNAFLMENLELRISLGRGFGLVTFLDGGNVWREVEDIDPSESTFTTGIGFRYETPVGPLRVDYGHKLQRKRDESRGELHFSIGHAF